MIKIENNEIFSTEGKIVHRIGTEVYFKRSTALSADNAADFEEVDEYPPYTKAEYEEKVSELIRLRYSVSDELAILRQREAKAVEFAEYNAYAEECKAKAKEILSNRSEEE